MQVPMSEEDTARKNIDIWSKRLHVFEDKCIRRGIALSGEMDVARTRLKEEKWGGTPDSHEDVTRLREILRSLRRKAADEDHAGEWAEKTRYGLRAFLDPGKLILADIICYIKSLTYEIRMYLGPELYAMDGEELEVAYGNRLDHGRSMPVI
jgi:hypothetical protein